MDDAPNHCQPPIIAPRLGKAPSRLTFCSSSLPLPTYLSAPQTHPISAHQHTACAAFSRSGDATGGAFTDPVICRGLATRAAQYNPETTGGGREVAFVALLLLLLLLLLLSAAERSAAQAWRRARARA
ncbi:hypothetical protein VTK73DRAFT_5987 [Phialemonium thermophilum]|uniref:Uncharacterized protein n=1 Tax=Phialemonium thermophilum TaxID=223376 RepID=A0ABR3V065_9PEZI